MKVTAGERNEGRICSLTTNMLFYFLIFIIHFTGECLRTAKESTHFLEPRFPLPTSFPAASPEARSYLGGGRRNRKGLDKYSLTAQLS